MNTRYFCYRHNRRAVFVLVFGLLFCLKLKAQTFTPVTEGHIVNDGTFSVGAVWFDFNNDGYVDLFVANDRNDQPTADESGDNLLYMNNGDGTFSRITSGDLVNDGSNSRGATSGDYDKDGDLDIFITNLGDKPVLYRNNGNNSFSKITSGAIVVNAPLEAYSACWGDIDNDGDLDLFMGTRGFLGNSLFTNNGDGTFTQVTTGEIVNDSFPGRSDGANWADYDNDGDLDLFVANTFGTDQGHNNFLYNNNGDGTFSKITEGHIVNDGTNSRGGSWGDYDNDGDLDLFVTNANFDIMFGFSEPNLLYSNNSDGSFTRITEGNIVTAVAFSIGSCWGDFDNDGDLDIFVVNLVGVNEMHTNNGDGTFIRTFLESGLKSLGCASADYDNDGDLDIFVANLDLNAEGVPPRVAENNVLLRNDGNSNHWVNINSVGLATPTPEIGTKVRIKATINGKPVWQLREISSQTGFLSQNSLRVHFGLGDATTIDTMKIEWLSGNVDVYTNVAVDFFYKAVEGAGLNLLTTSVENSDPNLPQQFELSQNFPNPFNPTTTIKYSLPNSSIVTLRVYNLLGKEVATLVDNEFKQAGNHVGVWDGRNASGNVVASGLYLLRMQAGNFVQTRKIVLVQ